MNLKRSLAVLLLFVLLLCGCGGKDVPDAGISKIDPENTSEEGTSLEASEDTAESEDVTTSEEETEESTETETETETEKETEPPITFTDVSETVWATGNVNIRTESNTDSVVITVLKKNQSITRTGYSESWSRVDYNGQVCYISSQYLTTEEPQLPTVEMTTSGAIFYGNGTGHIVAIDAGHQGHGMSDLEPIGPGATEMKAKVTTGTQGVATGITEANLNLTVSLQLKEALLARGYQVVMIRESQDVSLSNAQRAQMANNSGAEIFLRIHANGSANPGTNGIVTMCPTPNNPYVSYLYDTSYRLSSLLVNAMCAATGANNQGVLAVDNMSGINWCTIPVSIVEMGYMSNPEEDVKLNTPSYQALLVQGMANAVDAYFGQ